MIIFRDLNTSTTSADIIAKVSAFLGEMSGGTWTGTYASSMFTFVSTDSTLCGLDTIKVGYSTSDDRPKYAYYDSDNGVLIFANLTKTASSNANAYQMGISGFAHNGFCAEANSYNIVYRANGAMRNCGNPNINPKAMLCPFVYAPYNGTSYSTDIVMVRLPNIYVSNNYYHVPPNTEVIDDAGTVYVSIAWHLFVKKTLLEG